MIEPRSNSWMRLGRLVGGLIMFAIEGAIVAGLFLVAFAISSALLAIL